MTQGQGFLEAGIKAANQIAEDLQVAHDFARPAGIENVSNHEVISRSVAKAWRNWSALKTALQLAEKQLNESMSSIQKRKHEEGESDRAAANAAIIDPFEGLPQE